MGKDSSELQYKTELLLNNLINEKKETLEEIYGFYLEQIKSLKVLDTPTKEEFILFIETLKEWIDKLKNILENLQYHFEDNKEPLAITIYQRVKYLRTKLKIGSKKSKKHVIDWKIFMQEYDQLNNDLERFKQERKEKAEKEEETKSPEAEEGAADSFRRKVNEFRSGSPGTSAATSTKQEITGINPKPNSTITKENITIRWNKIPEATDYVLIVKQGERELYKFLTSNNNMGEINNIELTGQQLNVKISAIVNNDQNKPISSLNFTYDTLKRENPAQIAELELPTEGTIIASPTTQFMWNKVPGATYGLELKSGDTPFESTVDLKDNFFTPRVPKFIPLNGKNLTVTVHTTLPDTSKAKVYTFKTKNLTEKEIYQYAVNITKDKRKLLSPSELNFYLSYMVGYELNRDQIEKIITKLKEKVIDENGLLRQKETSTTHDYNAAKFLIDGLKGSEGVISHLTLTNKGFSNTKALEFLARMESEGIVGPEKDTHTRARDIL